MVALLFEQLNLAPVSLVDRSNELQELSSARSAPSDCQAFFVIDTGTPRKPLYESSTDAMLVSQYLKIPTINGYSGQYPPGYGPADPSSDDYLQEIEVWALEHDLAEGLCSYDPAHGVWNPARIATQVAPGP